VKTHEILIFDEWNFLTFNARMFDSPEDQSLAIEIKLGEFQQNVFQIPRRDCSPGSSSVTYNVRLEKKLEGREYSEECWNQLIKVLRQPNFVQPQDDTDAYGWSMLIEFS
jgi:hypothetical protein